MKQYRNYIDGMFVESDQRFSNINPATGEKVADVHEASASMVQAAIAAGRRAVKGPWASTSISERAAMLYLIADEIERRFDDFLQAEIEDTGKPISLASSLDIPRGAANFRIFADILKTAPMECFRTDLPDGAHALNYAVRKALGVVGVISPWNLPLLLLTWKVAPALACGNAVVAKPSEETPGTATLLAEVMHSVGLPPGVFNLLHGFGPGSAGEFITTNPDIDAITFTGESRTGSAIMRAAAENVRPVSFELGGKNAAIVFADCDLDAAADGLMRAIFLNTGQICMCSERVYVQRPIFDAFIQALKKRVSALHIGDPRDPATTMGPLSSAEHRSKVLNYFKLAREEGAQFITGGGVPVMPDALAQGFWVDPTVIIGLPESARCMREEVFGPICHVAAFDTEQEVIELANDTPYGLAASIWTRDLETAHRVAESMRVGQAWVNSWFLRDLRVPFGGSGISGIGREGGLHSLNFYSEITNVCIRVAAARKN